MLVLLSCVAETPKGASGLTTCCQLYSVPCTGEFFCALHLGLAFCAAAYVDTHIQAYKPPPATPEGAFSVILRCSPCWAGACVYLATVLTPVLL